MFTDPPWSHSSLFSALSDTLSTELGIKKPPNSRARAGRTSTWGTRLLGISDLNDLQQIQTTFKDMKGEEDFRSTVLQTLWKLRIIVPETYAGESTIGMKLGIVVINKIAKKIDGLLGPDKGNRTGRRL